MSEVEIICLSPSWSTTLLKASLPLLSKQPTLIEYTQRTLKNDTTERSFTELPFLKIGGVATLFGLRAILRYLFNNTPQLKNISETDSLLSILNSLYNHASILIAKDMSVSINSALLQRVQSHFSTLISIASKYSNSESLGSHILNAGLNVFSALGISISPFPVKSSPVVGIDALREELFQFAISRLHLPLRYQMSPVPSKPMYFSTPIYYVNGVPHLGHVFTTTLVETIASWYKLRGIDCIYSTGTDEHGSKVQTTAAEHNMTPQAWADHTSSSFREAFSQFDIHFDYFIRTTAPEHLKVASKLWEILASKGYIYLGKYEGWYSKREEAFIPENQVTEVTEGGVTKHINSEDGAELEWSSEPNWMFKLSAMQTPLLNWLESNPNVITPRCYYNQIHSLVKAGLKDISVSRQTVSWGIPVPNDPNHQTMYVWIDALANYLTVAGWDGEGHMGRWPADMHTVGKDIIKFHAIYWPAFLIAADIPVYKRLLVHGWWTNRSEKMSKSLGNALDPVELKKEWGLEAVKYYLLRECTLDSDSDYSDLAMRNIYTNDLANTLGNLVMRIISPKLNQNMTIEKVPTPEELQNVDKELIESIESLPGTVDHCIGFGQTRIALTTIWDGLRDLNKYFTDMEPWKKKEDGRNLIVFYVLVECLRIIAVLLKPFMRQTSATILKALGAENETNPEVIFKYGCLKVGTKLTPVPPLFNKIAEEKKQKK